MKSFTQGQSVTVRCPQLKNDGAAATVKMISSNLRSIVLEFSTPVQIEVERRGFYIGQYVPLIQHDAGIEDLSGNRWEIE